MTTINLKDFYYWYIQDQFEDGIEYSACLHEPTPQELLERMELFVRLWNALNSLPEIQGRRIDAHIILGISIKEIAEADGVHEESVRQST